MHVDFPYHIDRRGRTAATTDDDHIRDLIEQVVFTAPMTVGELQALLQDIGGQIVAGPTSLGVYTVAVTGNEPPVAARNRALATLRAHAQVRLAEPLQPD